MHPVIWYTISRYGEEMIKKKLRMKCWRGCECRIGYEKKIASEKEWLCKCECHKKGNK